MSQKSKEEKIVKLLKEIQKRPGNKQCADCTSRGNTYVVLNFNVFACTTCSGIHREIPHRIKSVGLSFFKQEEVDALDAGGNDAAKGLYMATWSHAEFPVRRCVAASHVILTTYLLCCNTPPSPAVTRIAHGVTGRCPTRTTPP